MLLIFSYIQVSKQSVVLLTSSKYHLELGINEKSYYNLI